MTRRYLLPLMLVLLAVATAAWAVSLTLFQAVPEGSAVRLEWEVMSEANVTAFEVYRKSARETDFSRLGSVAPSGQRSYEYLDANAPAPAECPCTYRLSVRSGEAERQYAAVTSAAPGAWERSWESIRAMFL